MNELIQEVLRELFLDTQGRSIEWKIDPVPDVYADRSLLKQVWTNLLSNALKFTRHREAALIEVGCREEDKQRIYFVRDNGAGFDMEYADKLFGVFQRLHSEKDFEGTGVGLSIVQRIIHRHGGRIWAESQVNHGASFYFTLPD